MSLPHHYTAPCHKQPGRQRWHRLCALLHPVRFIRSGSVIDRPRPPEPAGVGAVVKDWDGWRWVHASKVSGGANWVRVNVTDEGHAWRGYADIDVVKVLTPGTTP